MQYCSLQRKNYHTIALISQASKVMLKILQTRLQQSVNYVIPDVQAGFRQSRGTREQIVNICWIIEKASAFLTMPKPLTVWITTNCAAARQAPLSLGFSRQEHWSGLPFPSPMHESEK